MGTIKEMIESDMSVEAIVEVIMSNGVNDNKKKAANNKQNKMDMKKIDQDCDDLKTEFKSIVKKLIAVKSDWEKAALTSGRDVINGKNFRKYGDFLIGSTKRLDDIENIGLRRRFKRS